MDGRGVVRYRCEVCRTVVEAKLSHAAEILRRDGVLPMDVTVLCCGVDGWDEEGIKMLAAGPTRETEDAPPVFVLTQAQAAAFKGLVTAMFYGMAPGMNDLKVARATVVDGVLG
jgi:hypothetical protein